MQQHCLTSEQLTSWYLARIEQFDAGENGLNSVLEKNPDALAIAKQRDLERSQGRILGPLHGIPVLIKDNIDTADKMHTSAGSLALANSYAGQDAKIVSRLRKAGAVLLGKTNMTEFANYISTENMPNGYSSRGGQVLHPYGKQFDPSGSSTGSGVAVSANFCAVAVGTDTCASVFSPAQSNGIVGLRPSVGSISQQGIIPICDTLDLSLIHISQAAGLTVKTDKLDALRKRILEYARRTNDYMPVTQLRIDCVLSPSQATLDLIREQYLSLIHI